MPLSIHSVSYFSPDCLKMPVSCRRKRVFEVYERKRKGSEERKKTRVLLGNSFQLWHVLTAQVRLPTFSPSPRFCLAGRLNFGVMLCILHGNLATLPNQNHRLQAQAFGGVVSMSSTLERHWRESPL